MRVRADRGRPAHVRRRRFRLDARLPAGAPNPPSPRLPRPCAACRPGGHVGASREGRGGGRFRLPPRRRGQRDRLPVNHDADDPAGPRRRPRPLRKPQPFGPARARYRLVRGRIPGPASRQCVLERAAVLGPRRPHRVPDQVRGRAKDLCPNRWHDSASRRDAPQSRHGSDLSPGRGAWRGRLPYWRDCETDCHGHGTRRRPAHSRRPGRGHPDRDRAAVGYVSRTSNRHQPSSGGW